MKNTLKKKDPFVDVPLWFAEAASKATKTPAFLVCIYLLHTSWKVRSMTFTMPNGWLEARGVSREVKRRMLRDLEAAGLITVERPSRKSAVKYKFKLTAVALANKVARIVFALMTRGGEYDDRPVAA